MVGEPNSDGGDVDAALKRLRNIGEAMPEGALDFTRLTYNDLLIHPFIRWADDISREVLLNVGYTQLQVTTIFNELHSRFLTHFKTLVSHGDTREKFAASGSASRGGYG
jgi:hypothetical protein